MIISKPNLGGGRLTPAFDVVSNPVEMPRHLAMQLAVARFDIALQLMRDRLHDNLALLRQS